MIAIIFVGDKESEKTKRLDVEGRPCWGEVGELSHIDWQEA